jgi:DNA-binding CsgD family transcriptional regulator
MGERRCRWCGNLLVQRDNERPGKFNLRRTCDRSCQVSAQNSERAARNRAARPAAPRKNVPRADRPLTSRQLQILQCVADGDTYEEIASSLFITVDGTRSTMVYVREKLRSINNAQAVAEGFRHNLLK